MNPAESLQAVTHPSEDRYQTLFNAIDEGFCLIEVLFDGEGRPHDYRFLEVNPAFEKQTGLTDAAGKTARELVPGLEAHWFDRYGGVVLTGQPTRFVDGAEAMGRWFDVYAFRWGAPEQCQVGILFTDITARKQIEDALRQSEAQSREILESITDAFFAAGPDWRITYVNRQAELALNDTADNLLGQTLWECFPGLDESAFGAMYRCAMGEDGPPMPGSLTAFYPDHERWYTVHTYPAAQGITIYFRNVTDSKRAEEEQRASDERFRTLFESLGQGVVFHDGNGTLINANPAAERILGRTLDEMRLATVADAAWQARREDDSPLLPGDFPTARALAESREVLGEIMRVYNPRKGQHRTIEVSAVPQCRRGEDRPFLVYSLFSDVTEQRENERERARLLAETQAQAVREHLINEIGQAVRDPSLTPDEVQVRASRLLGEALGLDRCYFSVFDPARNTLTVGGDWRRGDLPPIAGVRSGSDYAHMSAEFYPPGATSAAYPDIEASSLSPANKARFTTHGFRAVVGVAYREGAGGTITAAMGAVMTRGPRQWLQAEIEILEAAGTLVWTTLQDIRRQQRERHIASQLQDALIPSQPPSLPTLDIAAHYQPALNEASVGGDFFDVYPVEKGCTALVVADLSGKGLAAARQVATVRNMLRFALYNAASVQEAATRLSATLVEHDLLTGFATLFVGMYENATRTLTYVNCGQEPGLVCRAQTGQVELLSATGPVMGGFAGSGYTQAVVTLAPGDTLALFTDGLTEVGPTRREQLEASGVAAFLQSCVRPDADARQIADDLVACVNAYAQNGIRDDVALLVGIVS